MNASIEKNLEEWLAAAATGGLSSDEERELETWLAFHPEARAAHEETQAMNRLLQQALKKAQPDSGFEDRMVLKFRRRKSDKSIGFLVWLSSFLQGPKAALLGFAGILVLSLYVGTVQEKQSAPYLETGTKGVVLSGYVDSSHKYDFKNAEGLEQVVDEAISNDDRMAGFRAEVKLGEDINSLGTWTAKKEDARAGFTDGNSRKTNQQDNQNVVDQAYVVVRTPSDKKLLELSVPAAPAPMLAPSKALDSLSAMQKGGEVPERAGPVTSSPPIEETVQEIRKLIRNASVGLEVKSYADTVKELSELTREQGGYIATQNDRTQANGRTAGQVVVKLPPDKLENFVLRLRDLGTVKNQVIKTDDVTKAYYDTGARLRNARKTEERLLELMAKKTDKVADLLQVEKEIGRVRESIEQMQGELKLWDSLAGLATVTLDIVEQDLDRAAAYLLKEKANLSLYAADVEKTHGTARSLAEKVEAQILVSQVNRGEGGQINATLSLLVAPDKSSVLIEQLKDLGRVNSFNIDSQRVAQDGRAAAEAGTTKQDKVEIQLVIEHDEASRKTVNMQVVTPRVEQALDATRKSALSAGGEILVSNLQRNPDGHASAELKLRLPSGRVNEVREVFSNQGRVLNLSVQRNDPAGTTMEDADTSPVILALVLSDEEPPVQITHLSMQGEGVAAQAELLKKTCREWGVEVKSSSFVKNPNGHEQAGMVFRLPQKDYDHFLEKLQASGKTTKLSLQRQDRTGAAEAESGSDPVEIVFNLDSPSRIVSENGGIIASMRLTLSKSFAGLMKSVERIVTGFAFLLPWLLPVGIVLLIWKKWKRK